MTVEPTFGGSLMFPSRYIKNEDLKGRNVRLTISKVTKEELRLEGGGKSQKYVLYFAQMERRSSGKDDDRNKRLVLNKTNGRTIAKLYGKEATSWVGKDIIIYPTTCRFGKDPACPCVRIRPWVPGNEDGADSAPEEHGESDDVPEEMADG